jgi:hypothetical protein
MVLPWQMFVGLAWFDLRSISGPLWSKVESRQRSTSLTRVNECEASEDPGGEYSLLSTRQRIIICWRCKSELRFFNESTLGCLKLSTMLEVVSSPAISQRPRYHFFYVHFYLVRSEVFGRGWEWCATYPRLRTYYWVLTTKIQQRFLCFFFLRQEAGWVILGARQRRKWPWGRGRRDAEDRRRGPQKRTLRACKSQFFFLEDVVTELQSSLVLNVKQNLACKRFFP